MFLARKRIRLAGAEGFAEGLVEELVAKGPEYLAVGLEKARQKAISERNFDRADALRRMQLRLGLLPSDNGKSALAELSDLQKRVRRLENAAEANRDVPEP